MDSTFKDKAEPTVEHTPIGKSGAIPSIETGVEVPYLDSPKFLDNYFGVNSEWNDSDASFEPDLTRINNYIKTKIDNKEIPNDQKAVSNLLKGMEKFNNLRQETRSVVKLEVLSNYVEFLTKNDRLKSNLRRYG